MHWNAAITYTSLQWDYICLRDGPINRSLNTFLNYFSVKIYVQWLIVKNTWHVGLKLIFLSESTLFSKNNFLFVSEVIIPLDGTQYILKLKSTWAKIPRDFWHAISIKKIIVKIHPKNIMILKKKDMSSVNYKAIKFYDALHQINETSVFEHFIYLWSFDLN